MQNDFANVSAENENANLATVSFVETETERESTFDPGSFDKKINFAGIDIFISFDMFEGIADISKAVYDKSGLSNEEIELVESEIECFSEEWCIEYEKKEKEINEEDFALMKLGL